MFGITLRIVATAQRSINQPFKPQSQERKKKKIHYFIQPSLVSHSDCFSGAGKQLVRLLLHMCVCVCVCVCARTDAQNWSASEHMGLVVCV